jgi:formylglycine-generating enzyme required for sulfatase activity/tRNA A-37 threonylcarbamoyl transferase component Bud32
VSHLEPGAIFGKDFRIVRPLREGGMGAVYIAEQLSTGKQRALKVMAPQLATDPATRDRFVLEARAGSRIESDHVVEVVTAGIDETTGSPFLVMELLRGEELADAAARMGPMPLGDVAEVLSQMGHALELAHAQGIVHRDLKPENVFLASSRRRDAAFTVKILDFGIAKLVEDSLKKTGTQPLGTPLFMAPEQTDRKGPIRPATDVWALGLIAFKLLTGRDYWTADGSLGMLLREICVDPMPFASARAEELGKRPLEDGQFAVPTLPPGFDAWFARCVNRDVEARFPDAGEAVRAFAELVTTDAPRGALVAATGPVGSGALPPPVLVVTGGSDVSALGSTKLATDAALAHTAQGSKSGGGAKVGLAVAAVVLLGGGLFAYETLRAKAETSVATSSSVGSAIPAPVASASASSSPPGSTPAATTCPDGMVFIKGGSMFMGTRELGPESDSMPPHPVKVSSFCLDKTEVTTRSYLACAEKGDCERPPKTVSWPKIAPADLKLYSPFCNAPHEDRGDHPINCVAWSMAEGFCKKHSARLPTEAEWEFAARGPSQHNYPWGDEAPGPTYLNACGTECANWFAAHGDKHHAVMYDAGDGYPGTAPVGSFKAGASGGGVLDLAGNVWEWSADWYAPYAAGTEAVVDPKGPTTGDSRVIRGGDFFSSHADWARPAYRYKLDPDNYNHAVGFRCATSSP